jgi:HK97 family phage major capsid protein
MARNAISDYQRALANQPRFSLLDTVRALSTGGLGPRDRDALLAAGGDAVTPNSITLPWGALRRDLNTQSGGGAYLVGTATAAAHDALKPASVLVQAGCRVLAGLSSNVAIPRVTSSATIHWLSSETTAASESQPTLAGAHMAPHVAAVYCEFSRQLSIQGVDFEAMLRADLLRVAGQAVDVGGLTGSGASGQPHGILSASGIGSVSGSSLSLDDIMEMRKAVRDANGAEATTTWIAATDVADLLGQRERAAGSGFILDGGRIDGRPCIVSTAVPAGTLLLGDFSTVALAFWGVGPGVEIDPTANFAAAISGARLMLSMDIVALTPAALCLASSVT